MVKYILHNKQDESLYVPKKSMYFMKLQ